MKNNKDFTDSHSSFYKKAEEIFTLSRQIATIFIDDLAPLKEDGHEDPNIYFTGDIVQQSVSLAPEILQAENKPFYEEKHKHIKLVSQLAQLLDKNCARLENSSSNGKDFLPLLRKELKKFKKLQHTWMLTL
jgi:hypothetical protein